MAIRSDKGGIMERIGDDYIIPIGEDREHWIGFSLSAEGPVFHIKSCVNTCSWGRDMKPLGGEISAPISVLSEIIRALLRLKEEMAVLH
jgi:hypothetical protein